MNESAAIASSGACGRLFSVLAIPSCSSIGAQPAWHPSWGYDRRTIGTTIADVNILQSRRVLIPPTSWLHEGQTLLQYLLTVESAGDWTGSPTFAESPILRIEPMWTIRN